jgi:hypothetical protein
MTEALSPQDDRSSDQSRTEFLALIERDIERCSINSRGHYLRAEECEHWEVALGIPAIITGVGVGSAILSAPGNDTEASARILLGVLSIAAGVLTSSQTFFQFADNTAGPSI